MGDFDSSSGRHRSWRLQGLAPVSLQRSAALLLAMSRFVSLVFSNDGDFFYTLIAPHLDTGSLLCVIFALPLLRVNHTRIVAVLEDALLQRLGDALVEFGRNTVRPPQFMLGVYAPAVTVYMLEQHLQNAVDALNGVLNAVGESFSAEVRNAFRVYRVVNPMRTQDDCGWTYGQQPGIMHFPVTDQPAATAYLPYNPHHMHTTMQAEGLMLNPPVFVGDNWELSHLLSVTGIIVTIAGDGVSLSIQRPGFTTNTFMRGFGPIPRAAGVGNREEVAWLSNHAPDGVADP